MAALHTRIRMEVFELHGRNCHYCGANAGTVDHLLPPSRGGGHDLDNLRPACQSCNSEKYNRTPEEWRQDRVRKGAPWPPAQGLRGPRKYIALPVDFHDEVEARAVALGLTIPGLLQQLLDAASATEPDGANR